MLIMSIVAMVEVLRKVPPGVIERNLVVVRLKLLFIICMVTYPQGVAFTFLLNTTFLSPHNYCSRQEEVKSYLYPLTASNSFSTPS